MIQTKAKVQAHLMKCFHSHWTCEYLTSLREFHSILGNNYQYIKVDDIVSVHDYRPRVTWCLAVVAKLLVGNDGLTRTVEIRTSTGITNRPVSKLFSLEVSSPTKPTQRASQLRTKEDTSSTNKTYSYFK